MMCCVFQMLDRHDVLYVPHTTLCCVFQMVNRHDVLCVSDGEQA